MPESINFTQQRIEKLPIPSIDRKDYYDIEVSKLICRVSASGNKSFCVLKRMPTGKLRRITLGKWPEVSVSEARKMAQSSDKVQPFLQGKTIVNVIYVPGKLVNIVVK